MTSDNLTREKQFRAAFMRLAPHLVLRGEREDDADFLKALFIACSPLAGLVPQAMLDFQADTQRGSHNAGYPEAMHLVVEDAGTPIGRMMIDWSDTGTHLVDIAVLPEARPTRAGRSLLLAWLDVADAVGLGATLEVLETNQAFAIYRKLGFAVVPDHTPGDPVFEMRREPAQA